MDRILKLILCTSLIFGLSACDRVDRLIERTSKTITEQLPSPKYSTVTDPTQSISLNLPSSWKELGPQTTLTGEVFDLRVGSKRYQCQIEIISQSSVPHEYKGYHFNRSLAKMSVQAYADDRFKDIKKHSDAYRLLNGPFNIQINGIYGKQYVIETRVDGQDITVLYTLLKSETAFHQIIGLLDPNHLDKVKPELLEIVRSFQELKPIEPRIGMIQKSMIDGKLPKIRTDLIPSR